MSRTASATSATAAVSEIARDTRGDGRVSQSPSRQRAVVFGCGDEFGDAAPECLGRHAREQVQRERHRNHDRRQDEGLRHRVGDVAGANAVGHDRGLAAPAPGTEHEEVHAVAEAGQAERDAQQTAVQQQIDSGRDLPEPQRGRAEGATDGHHDADFENEGGVPFPVDDSELDRAVAMRETRITEQRRQGEARDQEQTAEQRHPLGLDRHGRVKAPYAVRGETENARDRERQPRHEAAARCVVALQQQGEAEQERQRQNQPREFLQEEALHLRDPCGLGPGGNSRPRSSAIAPSPTTSTTNVSISVSSPRKSDSTRFTRFRPSAIDGPASKK